MHRIKNRRPSASMLVACLALFLAIGGVGYAAATINSAAIVDNTIRSKDVRNQNLRGKDIRPDTLTGSDVNEETLGKVPSAASADEAGHASSADLATNAESASKAADADTLGGLAPGELSVGRYDAGASSCEPGASFTTCAQVVLPMPHPGRVLVGTSGQWHSDEPAGSSVRGVCRVTRDGAVWLGTTEDGSLSHQTDGNQESPVAGVTAVSPVLAAGSHTFAIECSDDVGDMDYTDMRISAVLLGSS